ncbi:centromere protein C isoform X2 [Rhineura floridana]|uniref:centromere protein C isoform X2 n=1 Tax=Rhineura floridana TaxID=261503 RepID=UPI002AC87EEB|nr:centromere protein C isoform X2 [Rhineura floridana]
MDSLNHLKDKYRLRYCYKEGQGDIQQGENVLKYIQDCFETCAKEYTVYSPSTSCSSSTDYDQVQSPRKEEAQPEPDKINYVKNVFNTFISLPSQEKNDRTSDISEDVETPSNGPVNSADEYVHVMSLGSPALLVEEEEKSCGEMLHFDEEAIDKDFQGSGDSRESEGHHARKETKELSIEDPQNFAVSSCQKKIPESLALLETVTRTFTQRNSARVEPEDECEFLIDESFGVPSTSWISASKKNQKPKNISLISSFEGKKAAKQQNVRRKSKRASEKHVMSAPLKQTKPKLTNVAERTVDGLQNASRPNERITVVDGQSQLNINIIQKARKQMHSKKKQSIEICSEEICSEASASRNHSKDLPLLLVKDRNFSMQRLSQSKQSLKQKCSKVKLLMETYGVGCQHSASTDVHSENLVAVLECDHDFSKVPLSEGEQLLCSKKTVKQIHSKMQPSVKMYEDSQEHTTVATPSQDCQVSTNTHLHSEDSVPVPKHGFSKHQQYIVPTAQQSSRNKPVSRQQPPKTTVSKKQLETQMNNVRRPAVRATRRRARRLVSEESSEGICDERDEGPHEEITDSRKTLPQKVRQTDLVSSEDNGSVFYPEDFCELYVAEKRSNASMRQQNSNTPSSHGPVSNHREDSGSGESEDLEEDLDESVSNTLKHKLVLPTNTPNVRRTKRMRLRPLEYWRGERVDYKTRPSGGFVVGGIISPEQREPRKPNPKRTIKPILESENIPNNSAVSLKNLSQPAVVFDTATNQEVLLECVSSGSSHLLFISNEMVSIYKHLTTPFFSTGKMILKPLKEKGFQYSHTDTLVFHITHGKLLLTLYDQCYHLTAGDYFFIPPGNVYNIRNLLNKECVVLFTQLKGSRPEN